MELTLDAFLATCQQFFSKSERIAQIRLADKENKLFEAQLVGGKIIPVFLEKEEGEEYEQIFFTGIVQPFRVYKRI